MKRAALWIVLAACVLSPSALAERDVTSLPFYESFDADDYGDLVWLTQGATHEWSPAGWSGGAARFTPPIDVEGYSGVGSFTNIREHNGDVTQLNVRFLIYHGSTYRENAPGNKVIIMNRILDSGEPFPDGRPMIISREYDAGGGDIWVTYGACDNTVCRYEGGDYWPDGTDGFRIGDPPNNREEEWICVEFEANSVEGTIRLYIHTQDEALGGLYVEQTMDDTGAGGLFGYVDILGGYFGNEGTADENNYFMLDELVIDDGTIGCPEGFGSPRPDPDDMEPPADGLEPGPDDTLEPQPDAPADAAPDTAADAAEPQPDAQQDPGDEDGGDEGCGCTVAV